MRQAQEAPTKKRKRRFPSGVETALFLLRCRLWRSPFALTSMRYLEVIRRAARIMDEKLTVGVMILSLAVSFNSFVTLACNPRFYRGNAYLRLLDQYVGGHTLMVVFFLLAVLLATNLVLFFVMRKRSKAGHVYDEATCRRVWQLQLHGHAASGAVWIFMAWTNTASLTITGAGAPPQLFLTWTVLIVGSFLAVANVSDRHHPDSDQGCAARATKSAGATKSASAALPAP